MMTVVIYLHTDKEGSKVMTVVITYIDNFIQTWKGQR